MVGEHALMPYVAQQYMPGHSKDTPPTAYKVEWQIIALLLANGHVVAGN